MVSVERIKQFTRIPSESAWKIKDLLPPPNWPAHGNVNIKDLQVTNCTFQAQTLAGALGLCVHDCRLQRDNSIQGVSNLKS